MATNLAWFELLGKAEDLEKEVERYRSVTAMQLREVAQSAFRKENGVVLYYKSKMRNIYRTYREHYKALFFTWFTYRYRTNRSDRARVCRYPDDWTS